jgi:hypothetical protein
MRRISTLVTIMITSFVMALCGLTTSSVATASENESVRVSSRFAFGSPMLTNTHKSAIEKAVTAHGTDATFTVIAEAGKLPGVSDSEVELLAIKRGQVFKSHLVKLGVKDSSVTIRVKMTRLGIVPKTKIAGTYAAPLVTTAAAASTNNGPAALTCATGGTCIVGDSGPGGGIVFYVDSAAGFRCGVGFTVTGSPTGGLCKYLEVAPSGWSGSGVADPAKRWAVTAADIPGIIDDSDSSIIPNNAAGIGLGYKNSDLIKTQYGVYSALTNDYAAGAARAYAGGSKNDWYLPTTAELNLLCQWNHHETQIVTTGCIGGALNTGTGAAGSGFTGNDYWSSSEFNANEAWSQIFGNGGQSNGHKSIPGTADVRPVRAF